jgi:uncharacterized membrane protein YeaQ/YmgE (transglycosylase-associated protein family)
MSGIREQEVNSRNPPLKLIAIALSLYIIWVASTYLLEGRIHLFQKVDPIGRMTYVVIANIAIGTVLSAIAIRYLLKARLVKPEQLGLNKSRLRTAAVISSAAAGGLALFLLQNPRTLEPIVVFNAFMQVLPVSIAEVMVCWALIGSSFESIAKNNNKGKIMSVIVGAIGASVFFGVYHYAHSPPFNQTSIVLFLMLPSIATALTYFLGRDIFAAIIVQNFMGIFGVIAELPNLEVFRQPMVPIYALCCFCCSASNMHIGHTEKGSERDTELFFFKAVAVRDNDKTNAESGVTA